MQLVFQMSYPSYLATCVFSGLSEQGWLYKYSQWVPRKVL